MDEAADFVVVGSGAAGATVAGWLARAGHDVVVVEEGPPATPAGGDAAEAMATLYRDGGAAAALGGDVLPLLQGCCVGGTTVINGGIQVPFPRAVWEEWVAADRRWATLTPWDTLEAAREQNDTLLGVAPSTLHGGNGAALLRGMPGAHPTRRNTPGCVGSGRCLQGCPHGGKRSVDRVFLDAVRQVYAGVRIDRVGPHQARGRSRSGAPFRAYARRAVVLAAGAIHSPWLLQRSGFPAGRGWMCHPGAAMAGLFAAPIFGQPEATQSAESLTDLAEGLKYEALGMPRSFRAARVPGVGHTLAARLERLDHVALWGVAVRAQARGTVHRSPVGPLVRYTMTHDDRAKVLLGLSRLAVGMLRAGATEVWPAIHGAPEVLRTVAEAEALATLPPHPGAVPLAATHLFGGTQVGERFEVAPGLVVADASVFPTNLGVNPMSAIMAVATCVARAWS